MADAYARASGSPAAAMGQGPFIGANGAFGVMEAATSSSPLILIGDLSDFGMTPRPVGQSVSGVYGSPDLAGMLRTMTKHTVVAATAKEAVIGLQIAIKHATTGCPGPTALLMRSNAITGEVDLDSMPLFFEGAGYKVSETTVPHPAHIAAAVELLSGAERPVILAGKGVHNAAAHEALRKVAEAWGVPVATTYKGKSAIAETHPLALGMAGTYGRPTANQVVTEADVVLVIGAKVRTNDTAGGTLVHPGRQRVVQIDIEPLHASWAVPAEVNLIGDARVVLDLILEASAGRLPAPDLLQRRAQALKARLDADSVATDPGAAEDAAPVRPQRLARLLSEHLDSESNVCLDAGNNRVWMGLFAGAQRPFSYFAPGGLAGMGWALPAALGVKLARPTQPSVAVTGDGGFMMSVHALATAVELAIPITCVVMNDSGLGMVRQHQGDRVIASTFGSTDHAAIARGFGAEGYTVTHSKELPEILEFAQRENKTAVIDVITDQQPSPDVFRARPRAVTET
jgi:acetolactate synthase-1/2/3 large subunit